MAIYYALIHKDPKSDYGVSFPDFPGCVTAGATLDEAYQMAVEALAGHVGVMRADGDPIPDPSPLDAIQGHEDARDAVTVIGVPLEAEEPAVRVNISLPANELAAIDRAAERQGMTRSGFLVHAARTALRGEMKPTYRSGTLTTTAKSPVSTVIERVSKHAASSKIGRDAVTARLAAKPSPPTGVRKKKA